MSAKKGKPYAGFDDPKTGQAKPGRRPVVPARKPTKYKPKEVALGVLFLRSSDLPQKFSVTCLLGEAEPKVIDGYANWTTVDRKRRKALLEYSGKNPLMVEVSFCIDYFTDDGEGEDGPGDLCENDCHQLELMAGLGLGANDEPPKLLWNANAPHDTEANPYLLWVIESLQWGDNTMRNSLGKRVRQWGTLRLREWVGDEFISTAAEVARQKAKNKGLTGGGTYKVKKGDTVQNIARVKLGDAQRWREIVRLNKKKIRDPNHLKDGITIKIPKV